MKTKEINTLLQDKAKVLGQFFTKPKIIEKVLDILFQYKNYAQKIRILEPSFGTGNFIKALEKRGFYNIEACEIDKAFTDEPKDFFEYPTTERYDLIIGNPPFTKYNIKESYYYVNNYLKSPCKPTEYLPVGAVNKAKEKIENVFILKSLRHLKNANSTIAFVLPISFFIKNRNKLVKERLLNIFSTVIIIQNKEVWFDYNIPCCFAIFTNTEEYKDKIVLLYENTKEYREIIDINNIYEEIIPEVFHNKKHGLINNHSGDLLKNYLSSEVVKYKRSYEECNVTGKNILERDKVPDGKNIEDYRLAVVRVGNVSVGKAGLININEDILNDMFFIFNFVKEYSKKKVIKEKICTQINKNPDYFRNITCRVGSKSIKKEDIYNFKVIV